MKKILLQLDTDAQASVFDAVVAVDSGIDFLFTRSGVTPDNVRELVFGTIFTRGPDDLRNTAIFVGGSDVAAGEALVDAIGRAFFGPFRVSVMVDSNGANTTAAAAVLAIQRHLPLNEVDALVLGGTGPVGRRVARLLAGQGATVRLGSRDLARATRVADAIRDRISGVRLHPVLTGTPHQAESALAGVNVVVSAGAAGVQMLSAQAREQCASLRVAVDLNAVPPVGLEGIEPTDAAKERHDAICYGALGVGRTKMKIHKQAVKDLFAANDKILDAEEVFAIGMKLE
jgi:hypothetical protein